MTVYVELRFPPFVQAGEHGELIYVVEDMVGRPVPTLLSDLSARNQASILRACLDELLNRGEKVIHDTATDEWKRIAAPSRLSEEGNKWMRENAENVA